MDEHQFIQNYFYFERTHPLYEAKNATIFRCSNFCDNGFQSIVETIRIDTDLNR